MPRGYDKSKKQWTLLSDMDWNVVIILDAMRFDFAEAIELNEDLSPTKIESTASHTYYFARAIREIFSNKSLMYFNGNPLVRKSFDDVREETNEADGVTILDFWPQRWADKLDTAAWANRPDRSFINPNQILNEFIRHVDLYGQPRHSIIHLMQPHFPFIDGEHGGLPNYTSYPTNKPFWRQVRQSYKKNVNYILREVSEFLQKVIDLDMLSGRTIITADHGECLGYTKHNTYGHSPNLPELADLREVPLYEFGEFDDDLSDNLVNEKTTKEDKARIHKIMEDLGYMDLSRHIKED